MNKHLIPEKGFEALLAARGDHASDEDFQKKVWFAIADGFVKDFV